MMKRRKKKKKEIEKVRKAGYNIEEEEEKTDKDVERLVGAECGN